MITLILGETGAGKTSLAYAFAIMEMFNRRRLKVAKNIVLGLNLGGYINLKLQEDHLVYTDTPVFSRLFGHRVNSTYVCSGRKFGLPNDKRETDFYPPCSYIVFDEGQKDVDSRNFKNLDDFVKRGWEINRHMLYDLVYVSQWGNVDKVLRMLANRIIFVVSKRQALSKGEYKHVQSFWEFYDFENWTNYETWVSEGKKKIKTKEFCFDGDIRRCYDGYAFRPLWLKGRERADFNKVKHKKVDTTVESFNELIGMLEGK